MGGIIDYKDQLKDVICLTYKLNKAYSWLVTELCAIDFDKED